MNVNSRNDILSEKGEDFFRRMLVIRRFEEKVNELFGQGLMKGTTHLCIGQEAPAAGVLSALEKGDLVSSNHRGHGHALAVGCDPGKMMAEIMGKSGGLCAGRGGTQHMAEKKLGFLGTNGITAGGIPIATGAALTQKMLGTGAVVVSFFGDGATNQGAFHEAVNIGSLWKLPVLYVCENNHYGMSTAFSEASSASSVSQRAAAYNVPARQVDGNDVFAIHELAREMLSRIREDCGPRLIEALTWRQCGHSKSDNNEYRPANLEAEWLDRDPVERIKTLLISEKVLNPEEVIEIEKQVDQDIEKAVEFGRQSPPPASESLLEGVTA